MHMDQDKLLKLYNREIISNRYMISVGDYDFGVYLVGAKFILLKRDGPRLVAKKVFSSDILQTRYLEIVYEFCAFESPDALIYE